jgi:hypothetical protein
MAGRFCSKSSTLLPALFHHKTSSPPSHHHGGSVNIARNYVGEYRGIYDAEPVHTVDAQPFIYNAVRTHARSTADVVNPTPSTAQGISRIIRKPDMSPTWWNRRE